MKGTLPADQLRETITRVDDTTNPDYGFASLSDLPIEHLLSNGIVCLDKPSGPTSHEVATWVRKILHADKAGHSGTLDPAVTGILPMGIGNATKAMQALLPAGKEYVCIMELHNTASENEIYYNNILEIKGRLVLSRVGCEAGTYIRKLCSDIGEALGVGAHMKELRRTRVGKLKEEEYLCTLHDLKDAYHFWTDDEDETELRKFVLPLEKALEHLPYLSVRDSAVDALCHGADIAASGVVNLTTGIQKGDLLALKTLKGEAIGIAISDLTSDQIAKAKSGIVAVTERVFMERGRYPSMWKKHSE